MQKRIQNFAYLVKTTILFKNVTKLIRSTDSVVLSSDRALLEYGRLVRKISSFTSRQDYQANLQGKSNNLLHSGSMTEFVHQNKCSLNCAQKQCAEFRLWKKYRYAEI